MNTGDLMQSVSNYQSMLDNWDNQGRQAGAEDGGKVLDRALGAPFALVARMLTAHTQLRTAFEGNSLEQARPALVAFNEAVDEIVALDPPQPIEGVRID